MAMAEFKEVGVNTIPFEKHPLYDEAMQKARNGDEDGAIAALRRLAELYPEEQFINDLLLRFQLRTTFSTEEHIPVDHAQGAPALRTMVLLMLAVTACLVIITVGVAAVNRGWLEPILGPMGVDAGTPSADTEVLWSNVERRLEAGDLSGVREFLNFLEVETPGDPRIEETRQRVNLLQSWADLYADAVAARERGDWQAALDLAYQIPPESPNHDRAQQLIQEVQDMAVLEDAWQEVQNLVQAEDWQSAISTLNWIRAQNSAFRRTEVEDLLYQIHVRLARELLDTAYGNLDLLRQAISNLSEALALRPTERELIGEKDLAVKFVAGAEAYGRGDWAAAVERWEPVYEERPDYQGSALERNLFGAYPSAAKQLISESRGSERLLYQALGYLDKALSIQPDDEELLEDRHLVTEYLKGLEAYRQESWDLAIAHWGPIHALRPDFLGGVLEENLGSACASSESPDSTFCLP
jgi:tetratricopeptide (TPR) repeat protein